MGAARLPPDITLATVIPKGDDQYKRKIWCDAATEQIIMLDRHGRSVFNLSDLPGDMLTLAMIEGLVGMMRRHKDARTLWLSFKSGHALNALVHPTPRSDRLRQARNARHAAKKAEAKPPRPLTIFERAIILALRDLPQCTATEAQTEKLVRGLTGVERRLWLKEPDVTICLRALRGERPDRLADLMADKLATPPIAVMPRRPAKPRPPRVKRPPGSPPGKPGRPRKIIPDLLSNSS